MNITNIDKMGILGDKAHLVDFFNSEVSLLEILKQWAILIKLSLLGYLFYDAIRRHHKIDGKFKFELVIFGLLIIKLMLIGINDFLVPTIYLTFFLFYFQNIIYCISTFYLIQKCFSVFSLKDGKRFNIVFSCSIVGLSTANLLTTVLPEYRLHCEPFLYPYRWFYVFVLDFAVSISNCLTWRYIHKQRVKNMALFRTTYGQLDESRLNLAGAPAKSRAASTYRFGGTLKDDLEIKENQAMENLMNSTAQKDCLDGQTQIMFWGGLAISSVEVVIGLIGTLVFQDGDDLVCLNKEEWVANTLFANLFMTAHTILLILSTIYIYKVFYVQPFKHNLVYKTHSEIQMDAIKKDPPQNQHLQIVNPNL